MSELWGLSRALQAAGLPPLTVEQLLQFVALASRLKDAILLVQPGNFALGSRGPILSPAIQDFLSEACAIPLRSMDTIWKFLAHSVWNMGPVVLPTNGVNLPSLYARFGHSRGITYRMLFPPSHHCMNTSCKRHQRLMLKKSESNQAVLFTLDHGAVPIFSVHLVCEECAVNYHHNFRVFKGTRFYYDGLPNILQIGEHQFAERKLVDLWVSMMLLSWTSATNCARIYNNGFAKTNPAPRGWQFKLEVTSDQVFDAFTVLSLLEDCVFQRSTLTVPHGGLAKERFTEAVRLRNDRFRLISQPVLWHYCRKCTRTYPEVITSNAPLARKVSVVVIDGVTLGHPCCGEPNCKNPLGTNRHRFCSEHCQYDRVCSVVGCKEPTVPNKKTCRLPEHQAVEDVYDVRGQSRFQLKERQRRAQVAHPPDALASEITDISEVVEDENMEEPFEFTSQGEARPASEQAPSGRKSIRAQFGRKRTHNEQLFVAPCGVIMARETFYHAEALHSVVEMIKRTYRLPGITRPDHIFYDNNCSLAKAVKGDPFFQNIGLTVDVFHFQCKHSQQDRFCRENCDAAAFPELQGTGDRKWYFNSSIAEQTNSWMGGYHAICREMRVDRYNFFLDEMVRRRNIMTIAKLEKEGNEPGTWPYDLQ